MKLGRNESCHCGSGKKYKHCHEPTKNTNNNQYTIIGIIAVVILVIIFINSDSSNQTVPVTTSPLLNQGSTSNTSKPSGPAPPGKVWSQEHGHWHDAPRTSNLNTPRLNTNNGLVGKPQPDGDPPPGKVWSQEHGHWHDAPVSKSLTPKLLGKEGVNKITVPPIDKDKPPEGKVWDEEHGHFHDKE